MHTDIYMHICIYIYMDFSTRVGRIVSQSIGAQYRYIHTYI